MLKHKELEEESLGAHPLMKQEGRDLYHHKVVAERGSATCPVGHDLQAGGCSAPAQSVWHISCKNKCQLMERVLMLKERAKSASCCMSRWNWALDSWKPTAVDRLCWSVHQALTFNINLSFPLVFP